MNSRLGVTATTDMAVLLGVLGCQLLRRTLQVRLGTNPAVPRDGCLARGASACAARGTPIFVASRQRFMKYPGSRQPFSEFGPKGLYSCTVKYSTTKDTKITKEIFTII